MNTSTKSSVDKAILGVRNYVMTRSNDLMIDIFEYAKDNEKN